MLKPLYALAAASLSLWAQPVQFTVTPAPAAKGYHVSMRIEGLRGPLLDLKLPVWTPGYYVVQDNAAQLSAFRADDAGGRGLEWEKVAKNTWRVVTAGARSVHVEYDIAATRPFPAANSISESRGFVNPPGTFLFPAGRLGDALSVKFILPAGWSRVSTGLTRSPAGAYAAAGFDELYDAPFLLGSQELLTFDVQRVPHRVVIENVSDSVDRPTMLADLKKIVETSVALIGALPYKHYTFLMMGNGNGGIEHANSAAILFQGKSLETENGYRGWLSYVAHEYFHHFNVKRIRPLALGPFDYEQPNLTTLLWVSEGLSVYYQDLIMLRSGLMTREQYLEKMSRTIARVENATGHLHMSAAAASLNAWSLSSGVGGDRSKTISYYEKGPILGILLDLQIRAASAGKRSLDDVMRALYVKYYQQARRGFTDAEFRRECESAAGADLPEFFEYVSTTKRIDYAKYLAFAGLSADLTPDEKGARTFKLTPSPNAPAPAAAVLENWLRARQ